MGLKVNHSCICQAHSLRITYWVKIQFKLLETWLDKAMVYKAALYPGIYPSFFNSTGKTTRETSGSKYNKYNETKAGTVTLQTG